MKKRKVTRKKRFQQVGTIGIVSVFLAIVLIIIGNFQNGDKENISKADYSAVKIGLTNFGDEYGLLKVPASDVNNNSSPKQDIMTVSSSFYNYRYDHEIEKGWRDQGIAGELSGVGNPFGKFNDKLSEYYKTDNGTTPFGLYVGNFYNHWKGSYNAKNYQWCIDNYSGFTWAQNIANRDKYNAVCQGLVGTSTDSTKKDLVGYEWTKDSFKPGTIMCSNGTTPLPFFNKKFLTPNDINASEHTDDTSVDIGVVAENVGFPFRYAHDSQKGSYYVFDSKYDVVSFDGSESDDCKDAAETYQYYYGKKHQSDSLDEKPTLNYYYQKNQVHTRQNKNPQFLPFNGTNANGDPAKLDFGFGKRVDIPF